MNVMSVIYVNLRSFKSIGAAVCVCVCVLQLNGWKETILIRLIICVWFEIRGLVYALPFGSAHDMGAKDGICCGQWQRP